MTYVVSARIDLLSEWIKLREFNKGLKYIPDGLLQNMSAVVGNGPQRYKTSIIKCVICQYIWDYGINIFGISSLRVQKTLKKILMFTSIW